MQVWSGKKSEVIGLYDINSNCVAKYAYDAYGNCTIIDNTNSTIANAKAIRYRGYYLDSETGWYFLNARYYSPEWRRFISPDDTAYLDPESPNGLNLYAYCNNDPVNYADPSGHDPLLVALLIGLGVGVAAGLGVAVYSDYQDNYDVDGSIGLDYLWWSIIGGAIGAGIGFGIGYFLPMIIASAGTGAAALTSYGAGKALALVGGGTAAIANVSILEVMLAVEALGLTISYMAYESKKAAPRIKSNTKKGAYDKAFYKGGKKEPIFHPHGKYGLHFHPANLKFKHWHYYFSMLLGALGLNLEDQ